MSKITVAVAPDLPRPNVLIGDLAFLNSTEIARELSIHAADHCARREAPIFVLGHITDYEVNAGSKNFCLHWTPDLNAFAQKRHMDRREALHCGPMTGFDVERIVMDDPLRGLRGHFGWCENLDFRTRPISASAPLRTFDRRRIVAVMAAIIYLSPGEWMPDLGDDEPWLRVEASDDGRFFGSGAAWKPSGEWVGYCSLPENDDALADALAAAEQWAANYSVPTIWVQTTA